MIRVNGKEMIFGTWFTISNEGSAVLDLPFAGRTMRCEIKHWHTDNPWPKNMKEEVERKTWEQDVSIKWVDQELHVLMPYLLQLATDVREFSFNLTAESEIECHLTRQQLSGTMIVHVAMYLGSIAARPQRA